MNSNNKKIIFSSIACLGLILTMCLVSLNFKGTWAIGSIPEGIWNIPTSGYKSVTFPSGITEGNPKTYMVEFGGVVNGATTAYKSIKLFYEPNAQASECPGVKYYVEFQNFSGEYEQVLSIKGDGTIDPNCTHYKKFDYLFISGAQEVEDEFYIWFTKNFQRMVCAYDEEHNVYKWGPSTSFNEDDIDTTLKTEAKCIEKNNRGVTFDIDGTYETRTCTLNSTGSCTVDLPTKPTKTGYYFMGWAPNENQCLTSTMVTADKTTLTVKDNASYVACFVAEQKEKYYITFNSNGGTGSMTKQEFEAGVSQKISANNFAKTGYLFAGWNEAANGTGKSYDNKESITLTKNITLYAQWTKSTNSNIVINKYNVDKNNKIVIVPLGTTTNQLSQNIEYDNTVYQLTIDSVKLSGNDVLYTNGKVQFQEKTGNYYEAYTIVVIGDTNGDGEITTMDYISVYNHLDNSKTLSNAYLKAADMNSDDDITTMDYIMIYNALGGN